MRHLLLMGAVAMAGVYALPTAAAAQTTDATIVARAPGFTLTRADVVDEMVDARRSGDMVRMSATLDVDGMERIVRALADQKRLGLEARARGLDARPEVARELARLADAVLAEALEGHTRAQVDTSEPAVAAYFAAHPEEFRSPGRIKARHIVVATETEARAALGELRERPFAEVAKTHNTDASRASGGDLGWIARGLMVREFEEPLFALAAGEVSAPVKTSYGWHLILAEEIDAGTLPPLGLVKTRVVEAMKAHAFQELLERIRSAQPLTIDRAAIQEIVK